MSNARSPREVCSTTIGTSGLTVLASFRVWRPNPSRRASCTRSSRRESSLSLRPPNGALDPWSGRLEQAPRGCRDHLGDGPEEARIDVPAAVAGAVVAGVEAREDAAHGDARARERRVVGPCADALLAEAHTRRAEGRAQDALHPVVRVVDLRPAVRRADHVEVEVGDQRAAGGRREARDVAARAVEAELLGAPEGDADAGGAGGG